MALDLSHIPILDQHCHSLLRRETPFSPVEFQGFFSEGGDETIRAEHVPNSIYYRWAIKELARFLGVEPTAEAVLAARAALPPQEWAGRLFRDANLPLLLVDYGFQGSENFSHAELQAFLPCRIEPILRLETMAQDLIVQHETFEAMVEAYVATVEGAQAAGYVGLKSIIAYRTGLAISPPEPGQARQAFAAAKERARRDGSVRLADKPLNDHLVLLALEVAERQGLPIQFHTGFGDSDLDLWWANPLQMRPLFQSGQFSHVPFVLLHASYPYVQELGYLATLYSNVYMDVGLAIPFITVEIPALWNQVLGLTPSSKVLFSTDAYSIPEIYWLAARWGRWGLAKALDGAIAIGALTEAEAMESARAILGGNSARLYGVEFAASSSEG
jgi:hypothetical protein